MSPSSFDQSRTPALYPPDSLIAGRYRIERLLGRGTSGTVYKARDVQVGTAVALKLIHGSVKGNSSAAQRIHQEMRVAHNVRSDYIVNLYSSFVTDTHVGLVLEYVNGTSLFDLHQSGNVLTIHEITNIGRQVAIGLQAIHDAGIVHRDLKLENIMLDEHGMARITDFGVSILASSIEPTSQNDSQELLRPEGRKRRATEAGKVVGTIHYLSPEYLETQRCDHRADLYALGIVLYELVTGQFPYQHKNMRDLVEKKVRYDTPKANVLRPDCPEWLVRLIAKATARKPEDRYQSAKEMHEELAVALHKPLVDLKAQETRRSTVFLRSEKAAPRRSLQSGLYMIIGLLLMFGAFRIIESLYSQGNPFLGHIMNLLQ